MGLLTRELTRVPCSALDLFIPRVETTVFWGCLVLRMIIVDGARQIIGWRPISVRLVNENIIIHTCGRYWKIESTAKDEWATSQAIQVIHQ